MLEYATYELMLKANHYLIQGGVLTETHKSTITNRLLSAKSTPIQAARRFPRIKGNERNMYPFLYVLPYNGGEKLNTIFNQRPKTQILSMNNYELEVIRLLYLFMSGNPDIRDMVDSVLDRLKKTCFGNHGCGTGECFDAGLVTLRFLSATNPTGEAWISSLIHSYNDNIEKKRQTKYYNMWYYWLCLSELTYAIAAPEIIKNKDNMLSLAKDGMVMNTKENKHFNPIRMFVLRNCISRLPEYADFSSRLPYINKSNRICLDENMTL